MIHKTMPLRRALDANNALLTLSVWLRPGKLAFRLGQLRAALATPLEEYDRQVSALRERLALKDADGEWVAMQNRGGMEEYTFKTPADKREFVREQTGLLDAEVEVSLPLVLTDDHVDAIEEYMLPLEAGKARPPVDFAALVVLMGELEPGDLGLPPDTSPHRRRKLNNGSRQPTTARA